MKIAVQGLGRMGLQIARKLAENDHHVIAHNRSREPIDEAVTYGAHAAYTKQDVLQAFGGDQVILWIMLPAEIVDAQVDEWLSLLPQGSIIIDGGNSDFRVTQRRNQKVSSKGMTLIDVGTSGGVWGYQNGFSMMAGSDNPEAFQKLDPALKTLAAPEGAY